MFSIKNEHGDSSHDKTRCHCDTSWTEASKFSHTGANGEQAYVVCNKNNQYVIRNIYFHCEPLLDYEEVLSLFGDLQDMTSADDEILVFHRRMGAYPFIMVSRLNG